MSENIKNYKSVEEGTYSALIIGCSSFFIAILTGVLYYFKIMESLKPLLLIFILIAYQIFRRRKCPICGRKMQIDYSEIFLPTYYYCFLDKIKIHTKIESSSS